MIKFQKNNLYIMSFLLKYLFWGELQYSPLTRHFLPDKEWTIYIKGFLILFHDELT